jgi:hypothetical protein
LILSHGDSFLTCFQSNDFREKALAAQASVQSFESKIKGALKSAEARDLFSFDQEVALDSLISLRSLVISSLFSVGVATLFL